MKSAFDTKTAGNVVAYALLWKGEPAGKLFGVCPGTTWRVTLGVWAGPLKQSYPERYMDTATAGGGGYDKIGACVSSILRGAGHTARDCSTHAIGDLEALGYTVFRIV